jgi:hypothetical protein
MLGRSRLTAGETLAGSFSRQATRQRSFRSMEGARTSTSSGFGAIGTAAAAAPPALPPPPPPLTASLSFSRRASELNIRASGGSSIASGGCGAAGGGGGGGSQCYSHGVPYSELDRLFPGWHLHVVELSPPAVLVDEF